MLLMAQPALTGAAAFMAARQACSANGGVAEVARF